MARVFISHSSRDREQAEEIFAWLKAQGFEQGFLDIDKHQGIPPGERWEQKLYDELDRALGEIYDTIEVSFRPLLRALTDQRGRENSG